MRSVRAGLTAADVTAAVPTTAQNATAVWGAAARTLTTAGAVSPTKAKQVLFVQNSATTDTYYAALSVVAGAGILSHVSVFAMQTDNQQQFIRVTVDGGAAQEMAPAAGSMYTRGVAEVNGAAGYTSQYKTDWFGHVVFNTSCLVEVKHNAGVDRNLNATIDYSLV